MTQEQFEKVIELDSKLNQLYKLQKEIKGVTTHRLSYIERNDREIGFSGPVWEICNLRSLSLIGHILDKHDAQIRQEIEEEIDKVKREIEEL